MGDYCIPDALAPDLIIKNGKVVTVDKDFSFAEAVAVKDGKIACVGSVDEVEALRGAPTKTLNLQGKTLIPGINDSHLCILLGITSMPPLYIDVSPGKATSISGMREIVKDAVSNAAPGQWINGGGWNQGAIKELVEDYDRTLCKEDFDDITPDNPLYLSEFSYHTGVVNSAALKATGIGRNTPDPEDGTIVRGADGEATGYLLEKANALVTSVQPQLSYEEMRRVFEMNITELTKYGITSVTSANDRPYDISFYSNLYRDYAREGKPFPIRISSLMLWSDSIIGGDLDSITKAFDWVGTKTGFGSDFLRIAGVKVFADGIPPQKTAWSSVPYEDGSHGSLILKGEDDAEKVEHLNRIVDFCHADGCQIAFHTCGDLAVKAAVEAISRVQEKDPKDLRHYVIHGDWVLPGTMELMAKHKIPLTTQSELLYYIGDDTANRLGEEIAGNQWPMKELLDKGVMVFNGSDWPAASPDWRKGLEVSMTRKTAGGLVSGRHQALGIEEALRAYTAAPAWIDFMEDRKGSIEAGMLADFAVLGDDITSIDPHGIPEITIHMSIVGGNIVYNDGVLGIE
ncbi:MAG: amidohydrolase [Clostridiales bacterium]|nr:amidohydrolase [Clostridiales bacterium]